MEITDIVQTIAIIVSVLGLIYQLRREWLLHSAEMVTSLVAQFTSEEFGKRRRRFATRLEPAVSGKPVLLTIDYGPGVLGFYENVSHLVRRRALDEMMVWTKFSWELVCYFQCITMGDNALAIERKKNGDPTLYEEMEWLNARFVRIYRRKGVSLYGDDGRIRWLEAFFLQEKSLGSHEEEDPGIMSSTAGVLHLDSVAPASESESGGQPPNTATQADADGAA